MKRFLLSALTGLTLMLGNRAATQTTLALGDIAFTGYNSDGADDFAFIILKVGGIASGTTIRFTNYGWSAGTCGANGWGPIVEEEVLWTATSALPYGRQVRITGLSASTGTVSGTALNQSSVGDQIFALQGTRTGTYTMLAGIHMNEEPGETAAANWDNVGSPTGTQSNRPPCLTNGTYSLFINPEVDNARLRASVVITGNPATDRANINNPANWEVDDVTPYTLPATLVFLPVRFTGFTVEETASGLEISWKIAEQNNIEEYRIEQSVDGVQFTSLASLKATAAVSVHRWTTTVPPEVTYYRVRAEERNGQLTYSPTLRFTAKKEKPTIQMRVEGNFLVIRGIGLQGGNYTVAVYSGAGILIHRSHLGVQGATSSYRVNLDKPLASGMYLVTLENPAFQATGRLLVP